MAALQECLRAFEGSHSFHNYTQRRRYRPENMVSRRAAKDHRCSLFSFLGSILWDGNTLSRWQALQQPHTVVQTTARVYGLLALLARLCLCMLWMHE